MKELALPLGVYLSLALVVPLLRGAWKNSEFVPHALEVLSATLVVAVLVAAVRRWLGCLPRAR
jgi:hypothetical protein